MSPINLDWNAIRPFNGSRAGGFEELCVQLARVESPADSRLERKGVPDAGVECYAVLPDGSEWGWQAKYFDALSEPQWGQLDDSVENALQKHPRLARYYVCVPLDRPDARIAGRRSARERWDEHVQKWTGWAQASGMTVEFVWWGSSELLERLSLPRHVGRVRFWFDVHGFDQAWFAERLAEALRTAGPRYTPELHIDLPIAGEFEAFARTGVFFDQIKGHARQIRRRLQDFEYSHRAPEGQPTHPLVSALVTRVSSVLSALSQVTATPTGPLPFGHIAEQISSARHAAEDLDQHLQNLEQAHDSKPLPRGSEPEPERYRHNPFRERRHYVFRLSAELRRSADVLRHGQETAQSSLMILKGSAGTGKTHLLCDVAQHRIAAGWPTVLLMGQRFTSLEAPWTQALQQLDLAAISADEFVGALEAAAQVAGCRSLVMIDALNEGSGKSVWPSHLPAFLAHLEKSPWIGVVLSIRSSYEEIILPGDIRARAVHVTHEGFAEHEYDATKTFFLYYGLELPSTPLLAPEFRNPLFLKTLCRGLHEQGERRIPRGLQGITAIFDLYLRAINDRLASGLGYNPRDNLVRRSLEAFAGATVPKDERWLTVREAEMVVGALLPGREFERSLYRGLVSEGVLLEEAMPREPESHEEIVLVAYDRFADHLVAKALLDAHLDPRTPEVAFGGGGGLAFLSAEQHYTPPGLLEALCIQVPERTGRELVALAPEIKKQWAIGDAFRQSLVWRAQTAFSEETVAVLNGLTHSEANEDATFDVLVTVATLPEHPLNAHFLDHHLRKVPMPDRDAWWSTYLHRAWQTRGAVDRLIDWAWTVNPGMALEDESVDLAALVLAWMFTASNRYVRDRATKALVGLLTGRLPATVRLFEHFAHIDDPYVVERVSAVAYGVAMRSNDSAAVGTLATNVYSHMFASRKPPPHILLRDYARGVIERALALGAPVDVVAANIRPPYESSWPDIPTEEDIKALLPDWSRGSYDGGDVEWARNRIGSSVMSDDFARYVIGTNSGSTNWLSRRLEDPRWESPDEQLAKLLAALSDQERSACDQFLMADQRVRHIAQLMALNGLATIAKRTAAGDELAGTGEEIGRQGEDQEPESTLAQQERDAALQVLEATLPFDHSRALRDILAEKHGPENPPRLDLRMIQRYVLWRVFDLGWTTKRFGQFDRFSIGYHGREATKAERVGKKYQWIGYHEIMALVADHFQYRERYRDDGDAAYEGPWQGSRRDIDPSSTLKATPGGTSWDGHSPGWWGATRYDAWGEPRASREWVRRLEDLPKLEDFLSITDPATGMQWLNGHGFLSWTQPAPADKELHDVDREELWFLLNGYVLREQDADAFMTWAEDVNFSGRWMPDPPEFYRMFLGEYGWSPASRYFEQPYFGDAGWTQPEHCPVKIRNVAVEYVQEATGFDCSIDQGFSLRLPASDLLKGLGLQWTGAGAEYASAAGRLTVMDPTARSSGPTALLFQESALREYLSRERLTMCWAILGEKRVLSAQVRSAPNCSLTLSGAYRLGGRRPTGFLRCFFEDWDPGNARRSSELLGTIRSSGSEG